MKENTRLPQVIKAVFDFENLVEKEYRIQTNSFAPQHPIGKRIVSKIKRTVDVANVVIYRQI